MPGPLAAGERVLLIDAKDRRYLLTLVGGATFILRRVLNDRSGVVSTVTVAPGEQVLITVRDRSTAPATEA